MVVVSPVGVGKTGSCAFGGVDTEDDEGFGGEDRDLAVA